MMLFGVAGAVQAVMDAVMEQEAFENYCKTLSPENAEKAREERKKQFREELLHQRALEVAEAGRARNFWDE